MCKRDTCVCKRDMCARERVNSSFPRRSRSRAMQMPNASHRVRCTTQSRTKPARGGSRKAAQGVEPSEEKTHSDSLDSFSTLLLQEITLPAPHDKARALSQVAQSTQASKEIAHAKHTNPLKAFPARS